MRSISKTLIILIASMVLLSSAGLSYAADSAAEEKSQRIEAEALKARIDSGEMILIVDVRSPDEFMEVHVTGSLSVPLHQVEAKLGSLSPKTKLAFYWTWPDEYKSARAVFLLGKHGLKDLHAVVGGLGAMVRAGFPLTRGPARHY